MAIGKVTSGSTAVSPALEPFAAAPAALLLQRKLLKRAVSKFLIPTGALDGVFSGLETDYAVLRAGQGGLAAYRTLYFDTPELRCFHDHRRGRRVRQKIRIRSYPDRSMTFLEVKTRQNEFVAEKQRLELAYGDEQLGAEERRFLEAHCRFEAETIAPEVRISFDRMTLLGLHETERVTLDVGLVMESGSAREQIDGIAVLEVKQARFSSSTPMMQALRREGLRPLSMSKYCTALALTREALRKNRFLPALRKIERMRT
jgi:hypothetical protein